MVKNLTGGNKSKGQARKNIVSRIVRVTRLVKVDGEMYAVVEKMLGSGQCHVVCCDGRKRLCHIRGKFKGRGKRDNFVIVGSFLMIGLRDYESKREEGDKKLENCDLMEVYSEREKEQIRNTFSDMDWSIFATTEIAKAEEVLFDFAETNVEEQYDDLMKEGGDNKITISSKVIDINDI
tara:strand:+ start:54 stop:590 length:537 start_codon:yes stop_codon:yes gene_type:complete